MDILDVLDVLDSFFVVEDMLDVVVVGRGVVYDRLEAGLARGDLGTAVSLALETEFVERASEIVNMGWSVTWDGWSDLMTEISSLSELSEEAYLTEALDVVSATVRSFMRVAADNEDLAVVSNVVKFR